MLELLRSANMVVQSHDDHRTAVHQGTKGEGWDDVIVVDICGNEALVVFAD